LRILFLGDIVGRPGRRIAHKILPALKKKYDPALTIANGENAAGGNGITRDIAEELYGAGIDVLTMGNHVWDNRDIYNFIDIDERIIRPANYPPDSPGRGYIIVNAYSAGCKIGIVNLSGRIFMPPLDCPFRMVDRIIPILEKETPIIVVDFHAEATSEKNALGWYVDGRVTAVVGTHTHIQTADEKLLPKGTAYITDVGMTGPSESVLGVRVDLATNKLISQRPVRFEVAGGPVQLNAVCMDIDEISGKAREIVRIQVLGEE
jgi:metallophosphoesterase (TIGR00282 family)